MAPPPREADGATVLAAAELDGLTDTGACVFSRDGEAQKGFAGLLLAQYAGDRSCYLFFCDESWEVQHDTLHRDADNAKGFAERQYPGVTARWQPV